MDRNQEALEDLLGTLRWSLEIEWTDEQRSEFSPLCHRLSDGVPRPLLLQRREKRREAEKRAAELDRALKASRDWLRTKPKLKCANMVTVALRAAIGVAMRSDTSKALGRPDSHLGPSASRAPHLRRFRQSLPESRA